ncbi:hypothetical protein ACH0AB_09100 [Moraxella sp. 179-F 1C4 NHS]|nr:MULTISPECIES: hypothetical protein [Moraxella]QQU07251.1 hypothetical protein I6I87_04140 [Moraxella osloensis]
MPNQSTKSAVSTSDAIQAQTGLVNHSPLPLSAQTSSVNGLMVYSLLLYPTQARDKKNHRMLSMIFFVLGVLVIFRLTHG